MDKKTDARSEWSKDDEYAVDRCHHVMKICSYLSIMVLLLVGLGLLIYIAVNVGGGSSSTASVTSRSNSQPNSYMAGVNLNRPASTLPPNQPPSTPPVAGNVANGKGSDANKGNVQNKELNPNPPGRSGFVPPAKNPPPPPKAPQCDPVANFTIRKVGATISRYVSPDPNDGEDNILSLNFTIVTGTIGSSYLPDPSKLSLQITGPYGAHWPKPLNGLVGGWVLQNGPSDSKIYKLQYKGSAKDVLPGLYDPLTLQVSVIRASVPSLLSSCPDYPLATVNVTIDVTCSATFLDIWCDGERRWIPKTKRCVRTYKPCGQELAVGVPNPDPCTRYACYNNNRTCSQVPLGGIGPGQCNSCTPVSVCTPNCTNEVNPLGGTDNLERQCGDDGCGGICGSFGGTNGCDPESSTPACDANFGVCVAATIGSCVMPYNLFMGSVAPGHDRLNPLDQDGLQAWVLTNNDTTSTEPKYLVNANNEDTILNELEPYNASFGWPLDERTVPLQGIRVRVFLNSFYYPDTITNSNNAPGTSDVNFRFTIPPNRIQAMDAYLCGQDADTGPNGRDTFLALVREDCTEFDTGDINFTPADQYQGDDSNPPGGYCSRVFSTGLQGGSDGRNFTLVATSYSQNNAGPLWLEVVFTNSTQSVCAPICDGHKCGSNGCGGVCNIQQCEDGLECNGGVCSDCPQDPPNCIHQPDENFPAPYNETAYEAECGEDVNNCGDSCGTCPPGSYCQLQMGICVAIPSCDHNVPQCTKPYPKAKRALSPKRNVNAGKGSNKPAQYFCNTFCEWQEVDDPLPDIIPNSEAMVLPTYLLHWKRFDNLSCAFDEQCVFGQGERLILRFNTDIMNIGTGPFVGVDIYARPDIVQYAKCHQHPHMKGFAQHVLIDSVTKELIIQSSKQSYCVESSGQYQFGPKVPCTSETTCDNQGLEPGMLDRYDKYLDCQWLDITHLVELQEMNKWHNFLVSVNNGRPIVEYSYVNNVAEFPVFIPCPPAVNVQIEPFALLEANPHLCCVRPGGYDPVTCPDRTSTLPTLCDAQPPSSNECSYIVP